MIRHYVGDGCEEHLIGDFDEGGSVTPPAADVPTKDRDAEFAELQAAVAHRARLVLAGRNRLDHSGVAGEPEATPKEASEIAVAVSPTPTHVDTVSGPVAADVAGGAVVSDEAVEAYLNGSLTDLGLREAARQAFIADPHAGGLDAIRAGLERAAPFIAVRPIRERDSLARRLGVRFGELEEARATLKQAEVERDWLLAEADDDTRARFFAARREERSDIWNVAEGASRG
jgi:hypothetical protein